jgi:hypothetical protein
MMAIIAITGAIYSVIGWNVVYNEVINKSHVSEIYILWHVKTSSLKLKSELAFYYLFKLLFGSYDTNHR